MHPSYHLRLANPPRRALQLPKNRCYLLRRSTFRSRFIMISAYVTPAAKQKFVRQEIDLGALADDEVEIAVEHCGLCHSDLSVRNNDWKSSVYPAVLGHEAIGRVVALGSSAAKHVAKGIAVGQRVGVGW